DQDILSQPAQNDAAITASDLQALAATLNGDVQLEMGNPQQYFNGGHFSLNLSLSDVAADFGGSGTQAYLDFVQFFNPNGNGSRNKNPVRTTDPAHTYYLHDHSTN